MRHVKKVIQQNSLRRNKKRTFAQEEFSKRGGKFKDRFATESINLRADELTKENIRLDLDHCGGKMFLRVIFLLILQDNPMLVTGALKLLFRHFNQRQELVTALKNVQECYKSIMCHS